MLAEAVAHPAAGQKAERHQAEEALEILDRAAGLSVTTQALHCRRAHYLSLTGQSDAAEQERQIASGLNKIETAAADCCLSLNKIV